MLGNDTFHVLVTLFAIGKLAFAPNEPANISNIASTPTAAKVVANDKPANISKIVSTPAKTVVAANIKPAKGEVAINAPVDQTLAQKKILPEEKAAEKLSNKKAKLNVKKTIKPMLERSDIVKKHNKTKEQNTNIADSKTHQQKASYEISRVSVVNDHIHQCSQAQVAMSQCK